MAIEYVVDAVALSVMILGVLMIIGPILPIVGGKLTNGMIAIVTAGVILVFIGVFLGYQTAFTWGLLSEVL